MLLEYRQTRVADYWSAAGADPVTAATNRLTEASYDGSGNVTVLDGITRVYDPMNMAIERNPAAGTSDWAAIYTADDERLAVWDTAKGVVQETWTLRGLDGLVLRESSSAWDSVDN